MVGLVRNSDSASARHDTVLRSQLLMVVGMLLCGVATLGLVGVLPARTTGLLMVALGLGTRAVMAVPRLRHAHINRGKG